MNPLFVRSQARLKEIDDGHAGAMRMIGAVVGAVADRGTDISAQQAITVLKARTVATVFTGFEKILEDIAETIDGGVPTGREWHRDLILQLRTPVPEVRPALLDASVAALLDELRRFRHVERNVYSVELRGAEVDQAFTRMEELRGRFAENLRTFFAAMAEPPASD